MTDAAVIPVGGAYEVVVGHGVIDRAADLLGPSVRQVLVVRPEPLVRLAQPVVDRHQALMWQVGDLMHQWESLHADDAAPRDVASNPPPRN